MIVLDTHVLVWWLAWAPGITAKARKAIGAAAAENGVVASAISVLEIATAVRRGRLELAVPVEQWMADARSLPELRFEPLSAEIALLAGSLGDEMHGDPADRVIAATAIALGAPLVTADERPRASRALRTISGDSFMSDPIRCAGRALFARPCRNIGQKGEIAAPGWVSVGS